MDRHEENKLSDVNGFSAESGAPGHDNTYDEEYAAEVADGTAVPRRTLHLPEEDSPARAKETDRRLTLLEGRGGLWGAVALISAIASWILWPTVLGPVAVIAGFVAFTKGRRAMGSWSIALGLISFIIFLVAAY